MNYSKITALVVGIIVVLSLLVTVPDYRATSYSGSLDVLNHNGHVELYQGHINYTDYDRKLEKLELKALKTLSKRYVIHYR